MRWMALVAFLLPAVAQGGDVLVTVSGMDCVGCNKKVVTALEGLPFVEGVTASFVEQAACGALTGDLDASAVTAAIATTGYALVSIEAVERCPEALRGKAQEPWDKHSPGLDVTTISHGEEVDLSAHLVAGKYTIFDFGASWCGPCHEIAEQLAGYMGGHADVAVRVIELGGEDPSASYAQPAVAQHLANAPGLPWLVVMDPAGRVLKKTPSAEKAIAAIDRHRARGK